MRDENGRFTSLVFHFLSGGNLKLQYALSFGNTVALR